MKYILAIIVILIALSFVRVYQYKRVSPTKIPYDNGFYAGKYNPKLPKIGPKAK